MDDILVLCEGRKYSDGRIFLHNSTRNRRVSVVGLAAVSDFFNQAFLREVPTSFDGVEKIEIFNRKEATTGKRFFFFHV